MNKLLKIFAYVLQDKRINQIEEANLKLEEMIQQIQ